MRSTTLTARLRCEVGGHEEGTEENPYTRCRIVTWDFRDVAKDKGVLLAATPSCVEDFTESYAADMFNGKTHNVYP